MGFSNELAAVMMSDGRAWNLPINQEVFFARSQLWGAVVIIAGALTAVGGLGMAFSRYWGWYVAVAAALLMLIFPLMSRILLPKAYAFESLSLVELAVAAVSGLCASLAWMFRSK
jgi:hypothetical protein